jgi:hypothetical protein
MMSQPHPSVDRGDVERVVRRDFPAERVAEVLALLDAYTELERDRVQLAVLKLAGGDLAKVRQYVACAEADWREVLAPAEYPAYTKKWFRIDRLSPDESQKIIDADWKQYSDWLNR